MHVAFEMDNESMVWLLRKADADVNAMDGHGQTRLWAFVSMYVSRPW
ncbi:hypothetical protein [Aporhodopirellula rubra]